MASGLRAWLVVTGLALAEGQVFLVLNAGSTCLPWRGLFSLTSDRPPACCLYPGHVAWAVQIFFFFTRFFLGGLSCSYVILGGEPGPLPILGDTALSIVTAGVASHVVFS